MASCCRLLTSALAKRAKPSFYVYCIRPISTSKKNKETAAVEESTPKQEFRFTAEEAKKNWVTYGFDIKDEKADRTAMHQVFFITVTVVIVFGGTWLAYMPDFRLRDWAHREAFLELRRREENNLMLVHPDLIPVDQINLPTDEELGDTEIII